MIDFDDYGDGCDGQSIDPPPQARDIGLNSMECSPIVRKRAVSLQQDELLPDWYLESPRSRNLKGSSMLLGKSFKTVKLDIADVHDTEQADEEEFYSLNPDTYSLLFTSPRRSAPFIFAMAVFLFQIGVLGLMTIDMIDFGSSDNPLMIPTYVTTTVTLAQVLAIFLAVASQDDIMTSCYELLALKYDSSVLEQNSNATLFAWYFSIVFRLFEGMSVLVVSFFFVLQSTAVLDIFMNYAAIGFVANIDDIAFYLASRGYFGLALERSTHKLESVRIPKRKGGHSYSVRFIVFTGLFLGFLAGWAVLRTKQEQNVYLQREGCRVFKVDFGSFTFSFTAGDKFADLQNTIRSYASPTFSPSNPNRTRPIFYYAFFSGLYTPLMKQDGRLVTRGHRPIYAENLQFFNGTYLPMENPPDPTRGKFFYCDSSNRWVFAIAAMYSTEDLDCQKHWLMKSPPTDAYVLEDVPRTGWTIWTGKESVAETFSFLCDDCNTFHKGAQCNFKPGAVCSPDTGICDCGESGYLGRRCSIEPPCDDLVLASYGDTSYSYAEITGYKAMRANDTNERLLVYEHPLYYLLQSDFPDAQAAALHGLFDHQVEVVFFAGLRWYNAIYSYHDFHKMFRRTDVPFHAFWDAISSRNTRFISDEINYAEPVSGSPLRIGWTYIPADMSGDDYGLYRVVRTPESNVMFNCAGLCFENMCGKHGYCTPKGQQGLTSNRTCTCTSCYGGYFCEIEPTVSYVGGVPAYYGNGPRAGSPTEFNRLFWNNNATCVELTNGNLPNRSIRS